MALGNTVVRILVSVLAIPLILLITFLGKFYFLFLIAAIGTVAFYEFDQFTRKKSAFAATILSIFTIVAIVFDAYFKFVDVTALIIFSVVVLSIFELFRNKQSAIFNLGASLLGIFYIGLFSSTIISLREFDQLNYNNGAYLIFAILASIWACDSAAFFVGSAIGKHKMFPRVSPKKSWEGAIAGFIFSIIVMVIAKYLALDFLTLTDSIIIGIIVGTIGQIGDLIESLFKRDAGVKDSSNLIPGHGGIFDRFDSLILTAPTVYLYLFLFIK